MPQSAVDREDSPDPSPNKTAGSDEIEDDFTQACRKKSRWINIAICFGVDIKDIFKIGIRSDIQGLANGDNGAEEDDADDYDNPYGDSESAIVAAYKDILKLIPKLKRILPYQPDADEEYFEAVTQEIQNGCNAARSEAIRRIKDNTINYLSAGRKPIKVGERINHKALRGLNDPDIGRLLIPADSVHQWDDDPDSMRAAYLSGEFPIMGCHMPVFLYEDYTYNHEDPEEGLFQGAFLVCVLIDILFGTNSVDAVNVKRDQQPRHHCVGEKYDITTITPQNIAYAAVVARFSLSSKRIWNVKDNQFNYRIFYRSIMLRLSDPTDPWVQDTLGWWNERVFGNQLGRIVDNNPVDLDREDWRRFVRRQAGRKAALKTVEARIRALSPNGPSDREGTVTGTPPIPPQHEPAIDPLLPSPAGLGQSSAILPLPASTPQTPGVVDGPTNNPFQFNTPPLTSDNSILEPSPSVPRTPDAPGPSSETQNTESPLSTISEGEPTNRTIGTQGLKRKRPTLNAERPRARPKRKATRA